MKIINLLIALCLIFKINVVTANESTFDEWLENFKIIAKKNDISESTINNIMNNAKFLPKVIQYDRYQPEFYEDTNTYIGKRVTKSKIKNGIQNFKNKKNIILKIENKYLVERELLLSLMGIETNFGTYLGKMDIISSLATLSYDKRRTEFFTNELIVLLKLIDEDIVKKESLYGSWAGAMGNFQFMPTTIRKYAIDFDGNSLIELRSTNDSFASAANYISKIGWNSKEPCFYKIKLKENVPKKLLNTSAKKIKNKKNINFLKKYIVNYEDLNLDNNLKAAFVTPDKDIVENSNDFSPAYIVFSNYEVILKWNRSLRFALAVCTLKDELKKKLYD